MRSAAWWTNPGSRFSGAISEKRVTRGTTATSHPAGLKEGISSRVRSGVSAVAA